MGIQDRDYYWEKHQQASKGSSPNILSNQTNQRRRRKSSSGSLRYLLFPIVTIAGLWYGADALLKFQQAKRLATIPAPVAIAPQTRQQPTNQVPPIAGGIVLKTDPQGHFRGTVLVNNIPMPFLIDTGATKTVIPSAMAIKAGLPFGGIVQSNTAGGKVADRITQITSLALGNAVIRNLDAQINDHLDEVLIGMNTLKYFQMTQNGNTLTLIANNQVGNRTANRPLTSLETLAANQPIKKPTVIKKSVYCDEHKVCTTRYSDH